MFVAISYLLANKVLKIAIATAFREETEQKQPCILINNKQFDHTSSVSLFYKGKIMLLIAQLTEVAN